MLNMFLAEQAQKQARVMQHRVEKIRQTKDVAIQCTSNLVPRVLSYSAPVARERESLSLSLATGAE